MLGAGRQRVRNLGIGNTTNLLRCFIEFEPDEVVAIAGGRDHSLAVRADGTVWAWGWNKYGQVGDGTKTNKLTPVQVGRPDRCHRGQRRGRSTAWR